MARMIRNWMFGAIWLGLWVSCQPKQEASFMQTAKEDPFARARERMVEDQIRARGIRDKRVLEAMLKVPRHEFVPESYRDLAYQDSPLPIGHGQTISQPYIVAYMTEKLQLDSADTVLEIGTGSGYQAAILAELASQVYTIEIIPELAQRAARTLKRLGYQNIKVKTGDGYVGWPEYAPFDAIIITAAPPEIPEPLIQQLKDGGRLIAPVGEDFQDLVLVTRRGDRLLKEHLIPVRFVPMTGRAQKRQEE
jgi:protein-L-isoaspartate(D-aspartate) O-methyltransferase